uniref:Plectin/S10 N-terminal domain-containing protein n=1 Tax=Plectus sambesii TaxID=2011161 RepID=A0A914X9A8_9BILA
MLMPKKNRDKIYEYLFKEGVCVAKKDFNQKTHPDIEGVTNLQVIKACKSLTSREYCKEQFAWRHHYWYLTNEGINYLRDYLHLPQEIVPATVKQKPRGEARPALSGNPRQTGFGGPKGDSDRDAYRGADKAGDVGVGAGQMQFRSGFGRGAPPS